MLNLVELQPSGSDKVEALLPSLQKVRWLSTALNGGVKLSVSAINADKMGRCAFACVGLAGRQECAASVNDMVVRPVRCSGESWYVALRLNVTSR